MTMLYGLELSVVRPRRPGPLVRSAGRAVWLVAVVALIGLEIVVVPGVSDRAVPAVVVPGVSHRAAPPVVPVAANRVAPSVVPVAANRAGPPAVRPVVAEPVVRPALASGRLTLASAPPALRRAAVASLGSSATGLRSRFSASGVGISARAGGWGLRLGLGSVGRAGRLIPITATGPVVVGGRTVYRSGAVSEWFRSTAGGIEQGFSIVSRPAGIGPLVVAVPLAGLVARRGSGGVLRLVEGSRTVLGYGGLRVTDRTGAVIPSRLEPAGASARIVVTDRSARYPLTIDPTWTQQAEVTPLYCSCGGSNFGASVAISGTTAVIGEGTSDIYTFIYAESGGSWTQQAQLIPDDGTTTGGVAISGTTVAVGGNSIRLGRNVVYVFHNVGGSWVQQAELAESGPPNYYFGTSLAISGGTVLVGDYNDDTNAAAGVVYVFGDSGGTWTQRAKLTPTDGTDNDGFGGSVSLSGTTAVIGATGTNAGQGAAYVFTDTGGTWTQQAELTDPDSSGFGFSVGISGTRVVVTDPSSSAAFVYSDAGGSWVRQAVLTAADEVSTDGFGWSVAISGTTVVVGAQSYNDYQGAAYVFTDTAGLWTQQRLLAADGAPGYSTNQGFFGDYFGSSVAVSGDAALIGSYGWGQNQGAAYVFAVPATIAGVVSGVLSGKGIAGACVGVVAAGTGKQVVTLTANSAGDFSGTVPPGSYKLIASDCVGGTHATTYYGGADNFDFSSPSAKVVEVDDGSVQTGLDIALPLAGTVSGTVTDSVSGQPVAGICAYALDVAAGKLRGLSVATTVSGRYAIRGLPPGTDKVGFESCTGALYPLTYLPPVTVVAGGTVTLNAVLTKS